MGFACYLAMTAAEMQKNHPLPSHIAYMACHFSPYEARLSNCPDTLPPGSMLILNDRIPPLNHDPENIRVQLQTLAQQLSCSAVLLDFERPGCEVTAAIAARITRDFPCPVVVSALYAKDLTCPVLLPPVPPDVPLEQHLAPWTGRPVWLEAAKNSLCCRISPEGTVSVPVEKIPEKAHRDSDLRCHYHMELRDKQLDFTLFRTGEDVAALLEKAAELGVMGSVGLWQELGELS